MLKKESILVLKDVNLIDVKKSKLEEGMVIIVRNGLITEISKNDEISIPKEANVLNLTDMTIMPGLIDAHVHLLQSGVDDFFRPYSESIIKKLKRNSMLTLNSGVTTVRNMPGGKGFEVLKFRDKINKGKLIGPRILTSGPALSPPYGYFSTKMYFPYCGVIRFLLKKLFRVTGLSIDVDSEEQVIKAVGKLKRKGVDFVKTVTTGKFIPFTDDDESFKEELIKKGLSEKTIEASMKPEVLSSVVDESHKLGFKVAAHNVCFPEDFKHAVKLGVDSIEHTPIGLIDEETFELMIYNNTYWVPTGYCSYNYINLINNPKDYQEVMNKVPEPFYSLGERTLQKTREEINKKDSFHSRIYESLNLLNNEYFPKNFKNALAKGIKIAASVDAGASGCGYVPHGNLFKELELFVRNGMTEIDAIKTATINPAELLGFENKIGSIDVGKYADIVVLEQNPLNDINNLKDVKYVIKEGKIVYSK